MTHLRPLWLNKALLAAAFGLGICVTGGCSTPARPLPAQASTQASAPTALPDISAEELQARDRLVRPFALKEMPRVWQTVQALRGEIASLDEHIVHLRKTLQSFGRNPATSPDYHALLETRQELKAAHDRLYLQLQDAYLAAKMYAISPSSTHRQELLRQAQESGEQEAEIVRQRLDALRQDR
ncbi:MAG: hypothetical protein MSB12_06305 [Lentisphaeraceae bacterium]|nr:hypothetical protein [Lentisphaeraceae bacterium]